MIKIKATNVDKAHAIDIPCYTIHTQITSIIIQVVKKLDGLNNKCRRPKDLLSNSQPDKISRNFEIYSTITDETLSTDILE